MKKFSRLFALVLSLVMLFALWPTATVSAAEFTFSTFEELKELVLETDEEWVNAYYIGSGDLVISEDLTFADNFYLYADKLVVSKNVSFSAGWLDISTLTVDGTITVNHASVSERLHVNGIKYLDLSITLQPETEIIGCLW